ncbi:MAG: hypothetical protein U1F36_21250 [Planctomycetota bacterium]
MSDTTAPSNDHSRRSRLPLILIAGTAAIVLGLLLCDSVIGAQWRRARAEFLARLAADELKTTARPCLLDGAVPGESWREWADVLARIDTSKLESLDEVLSGARAPTDHEDLDSVLASYATELERLVQGARRSEGRCPADPKFQQEVGDRALAAVALGRLAITTAERRFARGEVDDALELLLASLQFARDLGDGAPLIDGAVGGVVVERSGVAIRTWLADARFTAAHRRSLDKALGVLDTSWPHPGEMVRAESMWMAEQVGLARDQVPACDVLDVRRLALWRELFSTRLAVVGWWDTASMLEDAVQTSADDDWRSASDRYAGVVATISSPLARMLSSPISHADQIVRTARARLRLLRGAISFTLHEDLPALVDPFTLAPLRRDESATRLRLWSLGEDGSDQGGKGWLVEPQDEKDIAIEVTR